MYSVYSDCYENTWEINNLFEDKMKVEIKIPTWLNSYLDYKVYDIERVHYFDENV